MQRTLLPERCSAVRYEASTSPTSATSATSQPQTRPRPASGPSSLSAALIVCLTVLWLTVAGSLPRRAERGVNLAPQDFLRDELTRHHLAPVEEDGRRPLHVQRHAAR